MQPFIITSLALVSVVGAAVHSIDVGNGGLTFAPNSLTASVGDTLEFHFFAGFGAHGVVSSTFESPCVPAASAFFSGFIAGPTTSSSGGGGGYKRAAATTETIFTVNVTSTDPIWFYCALANHCESGMVGVVNPPAGKTITDFANAAKSVAAASAPASVEGGVVATVTVGAKTSSSATSSGAAAATTSAAPKSGAMRNGDGAVMLGLGVVVGGLAVLMS